MKDHQMTWTACALALGLVGCEAAPYPHPEGTFVVGVQQETSSGTVENAVFDYSAYREALSSAEYQGVSYLEVTKPGFDITDTSDDAPEQILRVRTSRDSEVFSTWESLEELNSDLVYGSPSPPGIAGAPPGEEPTATTVRLGFHAVLSTDFQADNGVLEVDPNSADDLSLEWETRQENDLLTASAILEAAE
jgi:hypothetical protein